MGQARIRDKADRQKGLEFAAKWEFPPTEWEENLCEGLRHLEIVTAKCVDSEQLAGMKLLANECHANVEWYVKNDPIGESTAVTGWMVHWPEFTLHSVVKIRETYLCITPNYSDEKEFGFIPDPMIEWNQEEDHFVAKRNNHKIGVGLRLFPQYTMARIKLVRERMIAGKSPKEAGSLNPEHVAQLMKRHVDIDVARKWNPDIVL